MDAVSFTRRNSFTSKNVPALYTAQALVGAVEDAMQRAGTRGGAVTTQAPVGPARGRMA